MSTNFLQHNPTETNQETDAEYQADTTRTGGLGVDQIVPSPWLNKVLYQTSTMVAALGQMMSAKGYSNDDSSVSALAGVLANLITNADLKPGMINVPYSPTPTFDCSKANGFFFTMNGNVTNSQIVNASDYQIISFAIINNNNYSFAWPSYVRVAFNPFTNYTNSDFIFVQQLIFLNGQFYPLETELLNILQTLNSKQNALGFTPVQQGGGAGQFGNKVEIGWSGSRLKAQVDNTDLGNIVFDSNLPAPVLPTLLNNANGNIRIPCAGGITLMFQWAQGVNQTSAATISQVVNWPQNFSVIFRAWCSDFYVSSSDNDVMVWQVSGYNTSNVSCTRRRRGNDDSYTSAPIVFGIGLA